MSARRATPLAVHGFTAALAALAVVASVATDDLGFIAPDWVLFPLAGTLVVAGLLQLEFHWGGEREAMDLFEAILVPVIAVFAGPGAVAIAAVAKAASQRLLRVAPVKAVFNTAQWAASAGVAGWIYGALRNGSRLHVGGLAAALVVAVVMNHLAVATVIALVRRDRLRDVFKGLARIVLPGWVIAGVMNISFGLLFAAVVVNMPELSVLFVVPLGLFGWAQRAYSEVVGDRTRITALQEATHLLAVDDPSRALLPALDVIRSAFEAATVAIVPVGDGSPVTAVHAGDADAFATAVALTQLDIPSPAHRYVAGDGTAHGALLAEASRRTALVAPLVVCGRTIATLVSVDRTGLDGFAEGEVAIFEALSREITSAIRRWQLHDELVTERAHLFEIIDRSSDGIFTVTAGGAIGDWNPAMVAITGFRVDEANGGTPAALLRPSTPSGEPIELETWKRDGVSSLPTEIEILTRTGETRTLQCSFSETASEPTSLVVTARDVTKQRELDRLRDDFVATVSHELRTPLTSIVGFTSMLLEPPRPMTDAEHDDAVAMIRKGARRLERLIYNLLEVSRIEHRASAAPDPIDIEAAVENAIAELQETYPTRRIRVELGTGAVRAIGNQLSVEQIITNLLANALKYSERGPIDIIVTEAPERLTVSVRDHGPGIPAAEQDRIFERFHRMDQHHVQAGTGLGLYISRRLAAAMDGELTLDSTPGNGATFSLHLPAEVHLIAVC